MKIYIDFDGVILDTDKLVDIEYSKTDGINRSDFVKNCDWNILVHNSDIINNSLSNLKKTKCDVNILSKISSLNEGIAKVKYLRENGILANIHLVPTKISKSDMVSAKGNILIDDKVYNLEEWESNGGISIFFNKDNLDYDVRGNRNIKYKKINDLSLLLDDIDKYIKKGINMPFFHIF